MLKKIVDLDLLGRILCDTVEEVCDAENMVAVSYSNHAIPGLPRVGSGTPCRSRFR